MSQIGLSKSRILTGIQCPKWLYLSQNEPGLAVDRGNQALFAHGDQVGDVGSVHDHRLKAVAIGGCRLLGPQARFSGFLHRDRRVVGCRRDQLGCERSPALVDQIRGR